MRKNKKSLIEHSGNKDRKSGKKIKFKLDENIKKNKENQDFHIGKSQEKEKEKETLKFEDNNIKEIDNIYEEKKIEDDEDDAYFNQPLMKVHRMSMKKKELAKIRSNLKKRNNNIEKPISIESVSIDKEKAQQMAQNFFRPRLRYFNQIRINSESNDKNISDYITTRPRRYFNKILSNNIEIKTDFSEDKINNIKKVNNNNIITKPFKRLPTDIGSIRVNVKKEKERISKMEEKEKNEKVTKVEEKEKSEKVTKIEEKEKSEKKEKITKIEEKEVNEKKEKKGIRNHRRFKLNLDTNNNISYNEDTNKTTSSIVYSTQPNLNLKHIVGLRSNIGVPSIPLNKIKKDLNIENEKIESSDNLSSFRNRRKFIKSLNKEENEPKLLYKAVRRFRRKINNNYNNYNNTENNKKEIEENIKKVLEFKTEEKIEKEENKNKDAKKDKAIKEVKNDDKIKLEENKNQENQENQEIKEFKEFEEIKDVKEVKDVKGFNDIINYEQIKIEEYTKQEIIEVKNDDKIKFEENANKEIKEIKKDDKIKTKENIRARYKKKQKKNMNI